MTTMKLKMKIHYMWVRVDGPLRNRKAIVESSCGIGYILTEYEKFVNCKDCLTMLGEGGVLYDPAK